MIFFFYFCFDSVTGHLKISTALLIPCGIYYVIKSSSIFIHFLLRSVVLHIHFHIPHNFPHCLFNFRFAIKRCQHNPTQLYGFSYKYACNIHMCVHFTLRFAQHVKVSYGTNAILGFNCLRANIYVCVWYIFADVM